MLALEGIPPGKVGIGGGAPMGKGDESLLGGPWGPLSASGSGRGNPSIMGIGGIMGKSGGKGGKPGGRPMPGGKGNFGPPSEEEEEDEEAASEAAF